MRHSRSKSRHIVPALSNNLQINNENSYTEVLATVRPSSPQNLENMSPNPIVMTKGSVVV